jgi:hypothetical protein
MKTFRMQSDMGIKIKVSEISRLIIYYILILNACCDISLINCDIHEMRQKHIEAASNSESISDFKINPVEFEEHIMSGLKMTKKPDVDMVSAVIESLRLIANSRERKKCSCLIAEEKKKKHKKH